MNINVNHHKAGSVNMNINVDDTDGQGADDQWDESADAFYSHEIPVDAVAEKANEQQALKGASGTKHLSLQEMAQGRAMLKHIRDTMDTVNKRSNVRKSTHSVGSKKALVKHHSHRTVIVESPSDVDVSNAAPADKSAFSNTAPVAAQSVVVKAGKAKAEVAGLGLRSSKKNRDSPENHRVSLHTGRRTHNGVGGKGKTRISRAQQLVDHLPHSLLKKLQAAENTAGVGAEGPGAGSEITGWGEAASKPRGGKHVKTKFKPTFDFTFAGFGMKLAGNVETWQPGAAAWYAYTPPDDVHDSLHQDIHSAARSVSAPGVSLGFALACALMVCGLTHRF